MKYQIRGSNRAQLQDITDVKGLNHTNSEILIKYELSAKSTTFNRWLMSKLGFFNCVKIISYITQHYTQVRKEVQKADDEFLLNLTDQNGNTINKITIILL